MGFYQNYILPHLVHLSMRQSTFAPYRHRLVSSAEGRVLEIGVGSGLNRPFYSEQAASVIGLDPSPQLLAMARQAPASGALQFELLKALAEEIPLETDSIDTIVTAWTLCTIPDVTRALEEMHRVLRPEGRLLFAEHGRSPDASVRQWQDRLTPLWKRLGGGCHLNRPIRELIEEAGFRIEQIETGYMQGPRPMTFMYEGRARPA